MTLTIGNLEFLTDSSGKYYFDYEEGDRWVDWFELYLTHVKGDLGKQPIILDDWQKDKWVRPLFGWRRVKDNKRRYRTAFVYIPRKNGKTIITAGIGLGMIGIDGEYGAEGFICAATEEQARNLFDMCVDMIDQNPELAEMFEVFSDCIEHRVTKSVLRVVTGSAFGKTGSNPHFVVIDEYHEQPDFKLRGAMKTGMAARKQPLLIYITTAGYFDEELPWMKEYNRAKQIRDGVIKNDVYFQLLFEADKDDPWDEEATWRKANPGYGISVQPEYFEEFVAEARTDPAQRLEFEQFHLNRPVEALSVVVPAEEWAACFQTYTIEDLLKLPCYGGLDLGTSSDLSAFALLFPFWTFEKFRQHDSDKIETIAQVRYKVLVWQWITEQYYKDRIEDGDVQFVEWKNAGLLEVTAGNIANYALIRTRIKQFGKMFKIKDTGFDRYHAAEITTNLQDEDGFKMIDLPQSFPTMSPPTKRFKELVKAREISHNANGMLAFNIANARIVKDREKREMIKKSGCPDKIDGFAAVLNALCVAIRQPPPPPPSKIRFV